ncbi:MULTISPECIES: ABC transporter permease [Lacticaseibacillus]|jgi:ABC-2 type transport system permease protein|uniref:ABC transporter permease n=1 Tax=Lacticaseibacillus huelsenbergensis TaxID=3035291 RepID=A0ABY8DQR1_9LACO|nr:MULTISPECIES: ABC transporter permease [Lacticaseibacillus]MDG3060781.1 ABC transporter permease [Lacticaseibacillus sp. BCRC 81376]WFB39329.1 ABC transporter permease [Lacticaseibacillus huelsenbergensis]
MRRNNRHAGYLLKANLKQNLKFSVVWLVILIMMILSGAVKLEAAFVNGASGSKDIVKMLQAPGMAAMFGATPKVITYNAAIIFASVMVVSMIILQALWVMPLMIRDTRGQEESGLLEMVRARDVGRPADVVAAIWELLLVSFVLAAAYFASLLAVNMDGTDMTGDLLFAIAMLIANLVFGSMALLFAQLANNTRTASMLSYMVLAAAYLIRLVTDLNHQQLTWLSPIGWFEKVDFYTKNQLMPLYLGLACSILLCGAAIAIAQNRDLGAGVLAEGKGRATAAPWLRSMPALIWRTERGLLSGWLIGAVIFGGVMGSVLGGVGDILKTNPIYRQLLDVKQIHAANQTMVLSFLAMYMAIFVALAVTAGGQIAFRLKHDDRLGYLGIIHAEKPTRTTISTSYNCWALLVGISVFSVGLLALFLTGNAVLDQPLPVKYLGRLFIGGLPAVLAFITLGIALAGLWPKLSSLFWLYMGAGLIVQVFHGLFSLPKHAGDFTPFGWIADVPIKALGQSWLAIMLVSAVILFIIGVVGYRRQDLSV